MIRISFFYPNEQDRKFDDGYFAKTPMPLMHKRLTGLDLIHFEADQAMPRLLRCAASRRTEAGASSTTKLTLRHGADTMRVLQLKNEESTTMATMQALANGRVIDDRKIVPGSDGSGAVKRGQTTNGEPTLITGVRLHGRAGLRAAGFALLMAALAVSGRPASAQTMQEKIKNHQPIVVATEDAYRPFEFIQDGKPTGFDNELFQIMKSEAKFELKQVIIPFTGILAGVSTGKYDAAVTAVFINKDRVKVFDFAMPVADNTHYYLKRKNDNSIKEIKDLAGKTVAAQTGSDQLAQLPQLEAMLAKTGGKLGKIVQYTSYPEAYQDLASGRVDYVVQGIINLIATVNEKPGVFAIGQAVAEPTYVGWAVKKGNKEMLDYLNAFLGKMRSSGKLYELQQKWLKTTFKDMPEKVVPKH